MPDVIDVVMGTDDAIDVVFLDGGNSLVEVVESMAPSIDVVFEGEPGRPGPPGPAVNPYVYFNDTAHTWPSRPDLTTVVWVGGDEAHFPTESTPGFDLWVRETT